VSFDIQSAMRASIVTIARKVGAADTEDLWRYLVAFVWCNRDSDDQVYAVVNAAWRMGRRSMSEAEAEEIIKLARQHFRRAHMRADGMARWLGLKYAQRKAWGIRVIGSVDVGRATRKALRRHYKREAEERRRRTRGARPQELSLSRRQPWRDQNMSRAQWYRKRKTGPRTAHMVAVARRKSTSCLGAQPHRESTSCLETVSWTAKVSKLIGHEVVSRAADGSVTGFDYSALPVELRMVALGLPVTVVPLSLAA
jgi:hypothetical protein